MPRKNRPRVKLRIAPLDALVTSIVEPEDTSKPSIRRLEDGNFCVSIPVKFLGEALERKRAQQENATAPNEKNETRPRPRFIIPVLRIAGPLEDLLRKKK